MNWKVKARAGSSVYHRLIVFAIFPPAMTSRQELISQSGQIIVSPRFGIARFPTVSQYIDVRIYLIVGNWRDKKLQVKSNSRGVCRRMYDIE